MIYAQVNAQTEKDLLLMESIAIPLSFLVLVWVFGGLVAAALPMAVGGLRDPGLDGGAARDLVRSPTCRFSRSICRSRWVWRWPSTTRC